MKLLRSHQGHQLPNQDQGQDLTPGHHLVQGHTVGLGLDLGHIQGQNLNIKRKEKRRLRKEQGHTQTLCQSWILMEEMGRVQYHPHHCRSRGHLGQGIAAGQGQAANPRGQRADQGQGQQNPPWMSLDEGSEKLAVYLWITLILERQQRWRGEAWSVLTSAEAERRSKQER